jgi:hypothetical protein
MRRAMPRPLNDLQKAYAFRPEGPKMKMVLTDVGSIRLQQ